MKTQTEGGARIRRKATSPEATRRRLPSLARLASAWTAVFLFLLAAASPAQGAVVTDRPLLFTFNGSDTSAGRFEHPTSIAVENTTGTVYVADERSPYPKGFVCKFTANGVASSFSASGDPCLAGGGNPFVPFSNQLGVAVDNSAANPERLHVSQFGNTRARAFDPSGSYLWQIFPTVGQTSDIAVDAAGQVWLAPAYRTVAGLFVDQFANTGSPPAKIATCALDGFDMSAIDLDANGNLYIAQSGKVDKLVGCAFDSTLDPSAWDVYADQSSPTGHIFTAVAAGNEAQSVRVAATAGQFRLKFGAETTADIAFDAERTAVKAALEALPSIGAGNVSVSNGPGNEAGTSPYRVTFVGSLARTDLAQLACENGTVPLSGGAGCTVSTAANGSLSDFQEYDASGALLGSFATSYLFEKDALPSLAYHPALDRVYLSTTEPKPVVAVFGPEATGTVPNLTIDPPEEVKVSCATFKGIVNPQGVANSWHFEAKRPEETWASAAHYRAFPPQSLPADSEDHGVSYDTCALQGNSTFEVRLVGTNTDNELRGFSSVETIETPIPDPPLATLDPPTDITTTSAHIEGTIDPNEDTTEWQVETQRNCSGAWSGAKPLPPDVSFAGILGPQPVEYDLTGLLPSERYCVRIKATNGGGSAFSNVEEFETDPIPPSEAETSFAAPRLDTSARLNALVNPEGAPLTFSFEYSSDGGENWKRTEFTTDTVEAREQVLVRQEVTGLEPDTTYLYRLASAANEAGPVPGLPGEARSFTTRTAAEVTLPPNALGEPGKRGIELVNSPDKGNQNVLPDVMQGNPYPLDSVAASGEEVLWGVTSGAPGANTATANTFLAERTGPSASAPNGWQSKSPVPPPAEQIGKGRFTYILKDATPELSSFVFSTGETDIGGIVGEWAYVRTGRWGGEEVLKSYPAAGGVSAGTMTEISADGAHVVLIDPQSGQLVDLSGPGAEEVLSIVPKETEPGWTESECTLRPGSSFPGFGTNEAVAVSHRTGYRLIAKDDASRAYFQVQRNGDCKGLFALWVRKREVGKPGKTTLIDPGDEGRHPEFIRATPDGRSAYFVTHSNRDTYEALSSEEKKFTGKIDPEGIDGNQHADVYLWQESTNRSVCLTCQAYPDVDIIPATPVIVSDDFSHVYFESRAQLVPGEGEAGKLNVYVLSGGEVRFLASGFDADFGGGALDPDRAEVSSNGDILVLSSEAARTLTADEVAAKCPNRDDETGPLSSCVELYLYDDRARSLECLTCRRGGETTHSFRGVNPPGRAGIRTVFALSRDGGTVAFPTPQALLPEDVNNDTDVYEWRGGAIRLITDGVSDFPEGVSTPIVAGLDADGSDLFFAVVDAGLTGFERDGLLNLYDARIGGGFPRPTPVAHCTEDSCQGPLQPVPPRPAKTSDTYSGPGNAKPQARKPCARGKAKRGRRCLSQSAPWPAAPAARHAVRRSGAACANR